MGVNDSTGKKRVETNKRAASFASMVTGMGWWTANNNGTLLPTSLTRRDLGTLTDTFVTADFDGDFKKDLAIWSPGAPTVAGFRILKSSTNTVQFIPFGQTGDDPTVVGDWNGDGFADVAVYRDSGSPAVQNYFFWASLATPSTINYIPWGAGGDYGFALDYDGDAKLDAAVQRDPGSGFAEFWIRGTGNGSITQIPAYGLSSDFIVPGDYDGDGRDDIAVSRNADFGAGIHKYFFILQSNGGGSPYVPVQWGIPGDLICQGDYDGDGKTDIAIWRSNPDPTQNYFWVRKSSDGGLIVFEWGQSGDYPVNNWNVH
jgi:hypothetical protein